MSTKPGSMPTLGITDTNGLTEYKQARFSCFSKGLREQLYGLLNMLAPKFVWNLLESTGSRYSTFSKKLVLLLWHTLPYKIRIDTETLDIYVDGKKVQSLRPYSFVTDVKTGKEKLLKVSFNPAAFSAEVAMAYDLALLSQNKGKAYKADADIYLSSLY